MTPRLNIHSANILRDTKCNMPSSDRGPLANFRRFFIVILLSEISDHFCVHMYRHADVHEDQSWMMKSTLWNGPRIPVHGASKIHRNQHILE